MVFHRPDPKWQQGLNFREQDGVGEHVQHYLKFHGRGKLEIPTRDVSREEKDAFAATDPAVQSGLLVYEVRPWSTAMEYTGNEAIT